MHAKTQDSTAVWRGGECALYREVCSHRNHLDKVRALQVGIGEIGVLHTGRGEVRAPGNISQQN